MKEKILKIGSPAIQGIYSAICFLEVILCLLYRSLDNALVDGTLSLFMALLLYPISVVFVIAPIGVVRNTRQTIASYKEKASQRFFWLIWTILSPVLYFACFALAGISFVEVTGGV